MTDIAITTGWLVSLVLAAAPITRFALRLGLIGGSLVAQTTESLTLRRETPLRQVVDRAARGGRVVSLSARRDALGSELTADRQVAAWPHIGGRSIQAVERSSRCA